MSKVTWITPARGRQTQSYGEDVLVSISSTTAKGVDCLSITIYKTGMEVLGWLSGDRVLFGFDEDGIIFLKPDENGYALSPLPNSKIVGGLKGLPVKSILKIRVGEEFPFLRARFTALSREDINVDSDGVLSFIYPEPRKVEDHPRRSALNGLGRTRRARASSLNL